jgi:hypothetical protein
MMVGKIICFKKPTAVKYFFFAALFAVLRNQISYRKDRIISVWLYLIPLSYF